MGRRERWERSPNPDEVAARAIGFDVEDELALCEDLAASGGSPAVKNAFDNVRANRLFQALLSTGRWGDLDDRWKDSIRTGIEQGALSPPEWN
jgi:hypothetical protein